MNEELPEPEPLSTTVPLPTGPPAASVHVGPVAPPPTNTRRLAAFFQRHLWLTWALALGAILGIVLVISALSFHASYRDRAAKYDLDWVTRIEDGSLALDAKGRPLGQVALQDRRAVSLESVPRHLIDALVATEDQRFLQHRGYDLPGMLRAAFANLRAGGIRQGGSTITQQLARHSFNLGGRSYERKALEIYLAKRVEERFSKDEILIHYLNRIYLGSGFWGIEAAARGYFGKPVEELDLAEAATLCAIIKSPNRLSPFRDPGAAEAARNRTLGRMRELGYLDPATSRETETTPLVVLPEHERTQRPDYLLAAIRREANQLLGSYHELDGLTIHTSVDLDLQRKATVILDTQLTRIESLPDYPHPAKGALDEKGEALPYLQGAAVILENESGRVIASVGGRDFSDSEFDRVWSAKRKPGMTIVPLLHAYAYETKRVAPFEAVLDGPIDNREVMIGGTSGVLGEWGAESTGNDYEGKISALYALIANKSAASVRVGQQVGLEPFGAFLEGLEFQTGTTGYPNTFLGEAPARLIDLVRGYTIFANEGRLAPAASMITRIEDGRGHVVYLAEAAAPDPRMILPETAALIDEALRKVLEIRPVAPMVQGPTRDLRGRNGSSYGFEDNWFIGYNDQYTWGVWMGFDRPRAIAPDAFSTRTALPAWNEIAEELQKRSPPALALSRRTFSARRLCVLSGRPAAPSCERTPVGDLTIATDGPASGEVCPLHRHDAPAFDPPAPLRSPVTGVAPVLPKVPLVVGGNPWGP